MWKISLQKKGEKYFENKLTECVDKSKDLWNALKSIGLPNKSGRCMLSALTENQIVKQNTKSVLKPFKNFHSNLTESF